MKILTMIQRSVVSCTTHDTSERAAQLMWEHDVGALPVIDDNGQVCGMITDRDICMAAYTHAVPLRSVPVTSAMSRRVFTCSEDDDVTEVERVMREHRIRRMPVIDGNGHPVGIVTLDDLARAAEAGKLPAGEVTSTIAAVSTPRVGVGSR